MKEQDKPIKVWTADFETRGFGGEFTLGYIWEGHEGQYSKFYYSVRQFIDICNEIGIKFKDYKNVIYFHNIDYDSRYFIAENVTHIDTMKTLFIDSALVVLKFKKSLGMGYRNIEFRDSLKLFNNASLRNITRSFSVEHKKMEKTTQFQKYNIHCQYKRPYWCATMDEEEAHKQCPYYGECSDEYFKKVDVDDKWFREYCAVDCVGLYEVIEVFHNNLKDIAGPDLKLGVTIASTAMRVYKLMEPGKYDLVVDNKRREENRGCVLPDGRGIVREAYRGGRCEVFIRYGQGLHSYDVNSLYPSVMYDYTYPINPSPPLKVTLDEFMWMKEGRDYIVHATVECPDMIIPVLSVNMRVPGKKEIKYLFPAGTIEGYWCSPEFEHALELGYRIKEIHDVVFYGGRADFFKPYVSILYKIKQESKGAKRETAKLLLNTLYGKFGQRDEVHRIGFFSKEEFDNFALEENEDGSPLNHLLQSRTVGEDLILVEYKGESHMRHNYVSIAAFITSYARLRLYSYIEQCNKLGGKVWYVDTDSIKTDVVMPSDPNVLGALKDEGYFAEGVFLRPKMYGLLEGYTEEGEEKSDIKNKGVMRKVLADLSFDDLRRWLFMTRVNIIPAELGMVRMPKTRDIVFGKAEIGDMRPVTKDQVLVDDKRGLDINGIDTFPLGYEGRRVDQLGRPIIGKGPMHHKDIADEMRERGAVA